MKVKKYLLPFLMIILILSGSVFTLPVSAADIDEVDEIIASIPSDWPSSPSISAKAAILMDADSGTILYAKNATDSMYPASTTKLMTALLTLENAALDDIVTFSAKAVNIPSGSSHIAMRKGEQMTVHDCLYGLLLPSANEVANALAEHVGESIKSYVVLMNERAYQLGAVNTSFCNPNGLHEENHHTCAYDLALIMNACIQNSTFVEIASTPSFVHHADELLDKDIPMTNTNMMIRNGSEYYNEDVVCSKTGHTDESGYNLVTYAERDGVHLICVVMGCAENEHYVATQSLLDYGFNYFHLILPAELDSSLNIESRFTSSPLAIPTPDTALLSLDSSETILLPDNIGFESLEKTVEDIPDGKLITYTYQGYPVGSVTLETLNDEASPLFPDAETATEAYGTSVPDLIMIDMRVVLVIILLIIVLTLIVLISIRSRRRWRDFR